MRILLCSQVPKHSMLINSNNNGGLAHAAQVLSDFKGITSHRLLLSYLDVLERWRKSEFIARIVCIVMDWLFI